MRKSNLLIWALSTAVLFAVRAEGQTGSDALDTVTRSSSFKFVERDATCVYGAQATVGPQLSLAAEPVWGLHQRDQACGSNRTDAGNLTQQFRGFVFPALRQ